uniref:Uncharacterized protein n=1 Tax=Haptolina ericina TaxID=156174 RepID=A0A6T9LYH9_9EUKA|mmetsp:Transcript_64083/g.143230  ORF Transcript_64083/g.143230 Transcript_64083/m.143230 type:complete len:201 (+) Transcript_64083:1592-2194(+)
MGGQERQGTDDTRHTGAHGSKGLRDADRHGSSSGTEREDATTSKKSKASDAELIGIVSLYRLLHGDERQTDESIRGAMEASACAAPWKRSDSIEELLRELDDGTHRKEGAAGTRDEVEDEEDAGTYEGGGAESEEERHRESMDGTRHEDDTTEITEDTHEGSRAVIGGAASRRRRRGCERRPSRGDRSPAGRLPKIIAKP